MTRNETPALVSLRPAAREIGAAARPTQATFALRWTPPVAAAGVQFAVFLPWLRTGSTHRSAYAVLSALRGAGLMRPFAAHAFLVALAVLPGVTAAVWVLTAAGYARLGAGAAVVAGLLGVGTALTVRIVAHHRAGGGTLAALVAGAIAVVVGATVGAGLPGGLVSAVPGSPDAEGRL